MWRNVVSLCVALLLLGACIANKEVVDNTYPLMPGAEIVVSNDYEYLGAVRDYTSIYRAGQDIPHGRRPMDWNIFICDTKPRRILLISRWTTGRGGWVTPKGGNYKIDGVLFRGTIWKKAAPSDELFQFLAEKGYDYSECEFYKNRLAKTVSRSEAYNIYHFVERGELESEDLEQIKSYVNKYIKASIGVVQD